MDPTMEGGNANEDEGLGFGRSLPVPSVQDLVRSDSNCVPERYIQEPKYRPVDSLISHDSTGIPVINMSLLAQGDADELQKLDFACNDWGFFQMTHHRVAEEVLSTMETAVATFFDLPLEEKKKYAMAENDVQGYGQGYIVSEEQTLDWCDLSFLMTYPDKHKNFKNSVEKYSTEINKLAEEVFALLSLLLGLERESLQKMHGEIRLGTRMNYYPSCSRPDLVVGVSPHSEGSSLTFLLQDDEITGLQSKHHKGWVPLKPIPNAIVVNIGDFVESWSNGLYKSIEHKAVTSEEKARISIATFVLPEDETIIGPVPRGVASCQPKMYKSIKYVDYIRYSLPRKMDGKANIECLKV